MFPDFDDNLRQAFQRETEMLFESVMREDRSVLDLLDADYTFVNERLARHYGIPNVYGPDFRRVPVPSDARRGLLGHGSLLLVTSNPNRTSPVMRGKWILENLLGTPGAAAAARRAAARGEADRRRRSRCASASSSTAPARRAPAATRSWTPSAWRSRTSTPSAAGAAMDEGVAIDASAQLVDGTPINGPAEPAQGAARPSGRVRRGDDREAADVRRRPRDEVLRHAGGAHRDARRGEEPLSVLGSDPGRREERAVSDASATS